MVVEVPSEMDELPDRIADTLQGRTLLITGGSGFLGKVLIEKILRKCHGVGTVYLLLRPKKGKNPYERIDDLFNNMLFDTLKKQSPASIKKCIPIPGDITQLDLGISPDHRNILQKEVEFIFHSAASTRFDDTVRVATRLNTRGTKYMLDLAYQCQKLKAFVHVSTAYAHPSQTVLGETRYKPPADPQEVLSSINFDLENDSEEDIHLGLLGDCPNTYTFTKALAEDLVVQEMDKLPVLIVRPSIVCPTYREPISGWCNNLQGPMGLFVGAGKGIIRTMYAHGDHRADFVPVDIVINAMLAAPWIYLNHDKSQRIYNVTGSSKYSRTWEEIIDLGREVVTHHVPFNGIVWYPGGSLKKSRLVHTIYFYLFQIIPAILIDALLIVLGYKPVLYQIQRRIQKGSEMLEYFTTKEWEFVNDKAMGMETWMNEKEKEIYRLNGEGIDHLDYFSQCILTIRRNNLKETDDRLPAARRNIKIMWALDLLCKSLFVLTILYYIWKWIK